MTRKGFVYLEPLGQYKTMFLEMKYCNENSLEAVFSF